MITTELKLYAKLNAYTYRWCSQGICKEAAQMQ